MLQASDDVVLGLAHPDACGGARPVREGDLDGGCALDHMQRGEDGAVTESIPLIAGLLLTGALMAGFRRRQPQAD